MYSLKEFPHSGCRQSIAIRWLRIVNQICPTVWKVKECEGINLVSCYHGFTFNHILLSQSRSIDISLMTTNHALYIELKEQYASKNS